MKVLKATAAIFIMALYACTAAPIDQAASNEPKIPEPTGVELTASPMPGVAQVIDLPAWVADRNNQILLLPISGTNENNRGIGLINAATGEQFVLPIRDAKGYFWFPDGERIGLLATESWLTVVDMKTGAVRNEWLPQQLRFSPGGGPKLVTTNDIDSSNFMVLYQYSPPSPNGDYFLNPGTWSSITTILFDVAAKSIIELPTVEEGTVEFARSWSPEEGTALLALIRARGYEDYGGIDFAEVPDFHMVLYDFATAEIVATYPNVTATDWSPDATRILYQPYQSEVPCILNLSTEITQCYEEVLASHSELEDVSLSWLAWLPTGEGFAYVYYEGDPRVENRDRRGGLCEFDLASLQENCVLEDLDQDSGGRPLPALFLISSDGEYAVVWSGYSGPFGLGDGDTDFAGHSVWIVDLQTSSYYRLENVSAYGTRTDGLWRPAQ